MIYASRKVVAQAMNGIMVGETEPISAFRIN